MKLKLHILHTKTFQTLFTSLRVKSCHVMFTNSITRVIATTTANGGGPGQLVDHTTGGVWGVASNDKLYKNAPPVAAGGGAAVIPTSGDFIVNSKNDNTIVMEIIDVAYFVAAIKTLERAVLAAADPSQRTIMVKLIKAPASNDAANNNNVHPGGAMANNNNNGDDACCLALSSQACEHHYQIPVHVLRAEDIRHKINPPPLPRDTAVHLQTSRHMHEIHSLLERFRMCRVEAVTVCYRDVEQAPGQEVTVDVPDASSPSGIARLRLPAAKGKLVLTGHVDQSRMKVELSIHDVAVDAQSTVKNLHSAVVAAASAAAAAAGARRARDDNADEDEGDDEDERRQRSNAAAAMLRDPERIAAAVREQYRASILDGHRTFTVAVQMRRLQALMALHDTGAAGGMDATMMLFDKRAFGIWTMGLGCRLIGFISSTADADDPMAD